MLGFLAAAAGAAVRAPAAAARALFLRLPRKTWKAVAADLNTAGAVLILQWAMLCTSAAFCLVGAHLHRRARFIASLRVNEVLSWSRGTDNRRRREFVHWLLDGNIPQWLEFSDWERAGMLQALVTSLWPGVNDFVCRVIHKVWEEQLSGRGVVAPKLRRLSFGSRPLTVLGVKALPSYSREDPTRVESLLLLLDIRWGGRPEVVLSLAGTPVRMTHVQLSGRLRIQLTGLLDELPFVNGVQINFSNSPRPRVKFDIKALGVNVLGAATELVPTLDRLINSLLVQPFTYPNPGFKLDLGAEAGGGGEENEQGPDVAPPPLGVLTVTVVGAELEPRMRKLPPWQLQPVNGRVSLLLLPPPGSRGSGAQEQSVAAAAAAAVRQGAFTRRELPSIPVDGQGLAAASAAAEDTRTAAATAGGAAAAAPERFQFVVSSRHQALRLLASHQRRPGKAGYPMGWDRPLGLLEATVDELLGPTPGQVADAVHTAANTLHAAAVAVRADTVAAHALVAAAKAAAAAAQQAGSGAPPRQALAADQPVLVADQLSTAAGSAAVEAAAAADGEGEEGQARCFAWDAAQHATRYLKHAAAAAQDSATATAILQAASLADAAAAVLAPAEANGTTPAEPLPSLLWRSLVSCTYDVPSCGKRSMADLVGGNGSASTAAAFTGAEDSSGAEADLAGSWRYRAAAAAGMMGEYLDGGDLLDSKSALAGQVRLELSWAPLPQNEHPPAVPRPPQRSGGVCSRRGVLVAFVDRTKQAFGVLPSRPTLAVSVQPAAGQEYEDGEQGEEAMGDTAPTAAHRPAGTAAAPAAREQQSLPRLVSMRPVRAHQRGRLKWQQLFQLPLELPADEGELARLRVVMELGEVAGGAAALPNWRHLRFGPELYCLDAFDSYEEDVKVVAAARLPLADVIQRGRVASKWSLREVASSSGALHGHDRHLLCIGSVRATLAWYPM